MRVKRDPSVTPALFLRRRLVLAAPLMLKSILTSVRSAFGVQGTVPSRCVAVCIGHETRLYAGIGPSDIDFLVDRLTEMLSSELARYEGQDDLEGETRLFFSTTTPDRVVPHMLARLREISWCRDARVIIPASPWGG